MAVPYQGTEGETKQALDMLCGGDVTVTVGTVVIQTVETVQTVEELVVEIESRAFNCELAAWGIAEFVRGPQPKGDVLAEGGAGLLGGLTGITRRLERLQATLEGVLAALKSNRYEDDEEG